MKIKAGDIEYHNINKSTITVSVTDGTSVSGMLRDMSLVPGYPGFVRFMLEGVNVGVIVSFSQEVELEVEESVDQIIANLRMAYDRATKGRWSTNREGMLLTEVVEPEEATAVPVYVDGVDGLSGAWDDATWIAAASPERIKKVLDRLAEKG